MGLIYFSPVPWTSFAQRPHKFVEWFHDRRGEKVLWIDPYPTRLPKLSDFRRKNFPENVTNEEYPDWLTVIRPQSAPIEPLPISGLVNRLFWNETFRKIDVLIEEGNCLIAIGKPSELALQIVSKYPAVFSIYDAMDYFPAFYTGLSRIAMCQRERKIAALVSRITVSSTKLADYFAIHHAKLILTLNACSVETLPFLSGMIDKNVNRPILGYVGTIGGWFDWELVNKLAEANPTMHIRLVGPIYTPPIGLLARNVELLPACNHENAIKTMQTFSIGLIPFKRNDLTASVDPIKYYEYRALGLPILSTCFGEMALREHQEGIFMMDENSDLFDLVKKALAYECNINNINSFRTENSWNARFDTSGIFP